MIRESNPQKEPSYSEESPPYQVNPDFTKRKAKELYMLYGWSKQQLMGLGIPEKTLDIWLYKPTQNSLSWRDEKEVFQNSVLIRMKEMKSEELEESMSRAVNIMKRSLLATDLDGEILTVNQMEKLVNVIGKLDHIINLENGKPTSIKQDLNLAQKDIDAIVEQLQELDPLLSYDARNKIN